MRFSRDVSDDRGTSVNRRTWVRRTLLGASPDCAKFAAPSAWRIVLRFRVWPLERAYSISAYLLV